VGEYTWMEWSSDAEMILPWENKRHVTTEMPCAANVKWRGFSFLIHRVRVRCRDLNRIL
jgi:hypothetical protein